MFGNSTTGLIFLSGSWLFWALSVAVNPSLTVKEPRVFRSLLLIITHHVDLYWLKTLKEEKFHCNILVYHICCLSGSSAFSSSLIWQHVSFPAAFKSCFFPLLGWSRALPVSFTRALKITPKRLSFAFHLFSRGYSGSTRPCLGSPVTWKPYAKIRLNLLQPFFFP